MKTLTRNVVLLSVCVVAGLALLAVKSQFAFPIGNTNKSTLKINVKTGDTFTLDLVESTASGVNYPKWTLVSHSANITPTTLMYQEADSKKVGERKAVFAFEAIEEGQASVTFHQVSAQSNNILADSERTFNFTVK